MLSLFRCREPGPLLKKAVFDIKDAQHFTHGMIDQFVDVLRFVIEGGGGGHDDGTHLGKLSHGAEVAEVEGGFAH